MASYLDAAAIVSTGTALVLYQEPFGLTPGAIGLLSSLLTLSIAAGALVGGNLGDRFGRRKVFTATMILLVLGATLLAAAPAAEFLYVGVVALGFAAGADLPVSLALISEEAPEGARGKLVAFSQVFWYLGLIAAQSVGILAGGLGEFGARILYGHVVVVGIIVLVLRLRVPESRQWMEAKNRVRKDPSDGVKFSTFKQLFKKPLLISFVALALFYSTMNVAANTKGQFGVYMYVKVAGTTVQTASAIMLSLLLVSTTFAIIFMRLVDGPHRMRWFALGIAFTAAQFTIPAVFGITVWTLALGYAFGTMGMAFAFEGIFKVWTQESFPTLMRSTAQGAILAIARVIAAAVALWTPTLLAAGPNILFATLAVLALGAGAIGVWIHRLPKPGAETTAPRPASELTR
nr:MFS transporter [Arthrobacter sp. cf158]